MNADFCVVSCASDKGTQSFKKLPPHFAFVCIVNVLFARRFHYSAFNLYPSKFSRYLFYSHIALYIIRNPDALDRKKRSEKVKSGCHWCYLFFSFLIWRWFSFFVQLFFDATAKRSSQHIKCGWTGFFFLSCSCNVGVILFVKPYLYSLSFSHKCFTLLARQSLALT